MSWLTNNAVQIIFRVGVLDINAHGGIFYICEENYKMAYEKWYILLVART